MISQLGKELKFDTSSEISSLSVFHTIMYRSVYVAIFDGLVFKADLLALLNDTMRLSSFSQYSDGESTPLFDQLPSPASATTEIEQLDGGNGVALVNTTSGTNDSNIVVSATNSNFSNFDGVLFVDLLQVLRMGQASQSILPSWFELHLVTSNTAKLNGIASLPISVGGVDEWLQQ